MLDRGEHPECAVAAGSVVKDLQISEEGGRQLKPGLPFLAVEQLGLEAGPERLDDGIVERVADGAQLGSNCAVEPALVQASRSTYSSIRCARVGSPVAIRQPPSAHTPHETRQLRGAP